RPQACGRRPPAGPGRRRVGLGLGRSRGRRARPRRRGCRAGPTRAYSVIALLALALATPLPPSVQPWPIGTGPGYRRAPAPAAIQAGRPVGRFRCGAAGRRFGVHVELFARRQVVIIPAGIGVARPSKTSFGRVRPGGCTYPLRTLDPTGVIEVGGRATL